MHANSGKILTGGRGLTTTKNKSNKKTVENAKAKVECTQKGKVKAVKDFRSNEY